MTEPRPDPSTFAARARARFPLENGHPDVAGVLRQPDLLARLGPALADPFRGSGVTAVCAPEARGPILGALVAVELGVGLVLARKEHRNHPGADHRIESGPTWRGTTEVFQTRSWELTANDRVLIVDDWITTGSSVRALAVLIARAAATYIGAAVLVDNADDAVRTELRVRSLVRFDEIAGAI